MNIYDSDDDEQQKKKGGRERVHKRVLICIYILFYFFRYFINISLYIRFIIICI
jgi:hypothetical protein